MSIEIKIDDNGVASLSQNGSLDVGELLSETFKSNKEIKEAILERIKKIFDNVKINNKEVSEKILNEITNLFKTPPSFKASIQKTIKEKTEKIFDGVIAEKSIITKSIASLFEYKEKDKKIGGLFNLISEKVSGALSGIKSEKKEKSGFAKNIENVVLANIDHINPSAFKAMIIDTRIFDIDSGILGILTNSIATKINQEQSVFLTPYFEKIIDGLKQNLPETTETEKNESGEASGTVFEEDFVKVSLENIGEKALKQEEVKKKGGILGLLSSVFGFGIKGTGSLLGSAIGMIKTLFKLPSAALKFATNPLTMIAAGLIWGIFDGVKSAFKADEWGVAKSSAFFGGFMAGEAGVKGFMKNMGKWALIGGGVGMLLGPIGGVVGAVLGAVLGGVFNAIGAEKMAQFGEKMRVWFWDTFGKTIEKLKDIWDGIKFWFNEKLLPAISKAKEDLRPIIERIRNFFQERLIPDIKRFIGFFSPLFEKVGYFVTEIITPALKDLVGFLGDVLVGFFNNLGPIMDKVLSGGSVVYDKIMWGIGKLGEGLSFIKDKFMGIVNKFSKFFGGDEDAKLQKELDKLEKENEKRRKKQEELMNDLAIAEAKGYERKTNSLKKDIEKLKAEQEKADKRKAEIERLQAQASVIKEETGALTERIDISTATPDIIPVADNIITSYKDKKEVQFQLDGRDKLETLGNTSIFSKEGGTLDKALKEVKGVLEKQLTTLNDLTTNLESGLTQVAKNTMKLVEIIPNLSPVQVNTRAPAEPKISDGYIRDPIYEYRMKVREFKL